MNGVVVAGHRGERLAVLAPEGARDRERIARSEAGGPFEETGKTARRYLSSMTATGLSVSVCSKMILSTAADGHARGIEIRDVDLAVKRGQRVAIIGPNGCGKTTLVEIALGLREPEAGTIWRSESARVFYCDQLHAGLDPDRSLLDLLAWDTDLDQTGMHHLLKVLGIRVDSLSATAGHLSGGERTRLLLALLVTSRADLLVLDEPTRHLDLPSVEILARSAADFPGAVLFASHDRWFLREVATDVFALGEEGLVAVGEEA